MKDEILKEFDERWLMVNVNNEDHLSTQDEMKEWLSEVIDRVAKQSQVEYINFLRHEIHGAWINRLQIIKRTTGIDYDELVTKYQHRAMEVWHQQVRQWIDKNKLHDIDPSQL